MGGSHGRHWSRMVQALTKHNMGINNHNSSQGRQEFIKVSRTLTGGPRKKKH